jgi:murein L,D-transpeptidase YcbB/YkuD
VQIPLTRPVPVAIVYVTAWIDPSGTVQFRPDLYGNDPREEAAVAVAANPDACGAAGFG